MTTTPYKHGIANTLSIVPKDHSKKVLIMIHKIGNATNALERTHTTNTTLAYTQTITTITIKQTNENSSGHRPIGVLDPLSDFL